MGYVVGYDGVKFPATQVPSSDANTLDDYDEGTWTPTDASGAGLSFTAPVGTYEKIGRLVIARFSLTYPSTADGSTALLGGLPFTAGTGADNVQGFITLCTESTAVRLIGAGGTTTFAPQTSVSGNITNATMSTDGLRGCLIYRI